MLEKPAAHLIHARSGEVKGILAHSSGARELGRRPHAPAVTQGRQTAGGIRHQSEDAQIASVASVTGTPVRAWRLQCMLMPRRAAAFTTMMFAMLPTIRRLPESVLTSASVGPAICAYKSLAGLVFLSRLLCSGDAEAGRPGLLGYPDKLRRHVVGLGMLRHPDELRRHVIGLGVLRYPDKLGRHVVGLGLLRDPDKLGRHVIVLSVLRDPDELGRHVVGLAAA